MDLHLDVDVSIGDSGIRKYGSASWTGEGCLVCQSERQKSLAAECRDCRTSKGWCQTLDIDIDFDIDNDVTDLWSDIDVTDLWSDIDVTDLWSCLVCSHIGCSRLLLDDSAPFDQVGNAHSLRFVFAKVFTSSSRYY
jgi:hypothetical protein